MSYTLPIITTTTARDLEREREKELRQRMQTASAATDSDTLSNAPASKPSNPSTIELSRATTAIDEATQPPLAAHQRFVLTDNVAARYLEEAHAINVLSRRERLEGYEIYLVEQWACSRIHPTFIITTYTGDPKDAIWGHVVSVPNDESHWSPALRTYFKALNEFHARRRDTNLGTIMVTNLSTFPSSLTIIPIPEGDLKKHREFFFVNENLKRLGCSGRLGIKLAPPSGATQAKFHQLYRTSDKIPLNSSVIELVKLCQVALVLFNKLEPEYADGLLCDVTEKAINNWWVEFGAEYYTVEPQDGILGPTTVAALLGTLMGARNRLSACNAPVSKDVFDIECTRRGISHFQKTQRIPKTRYLDRQTLERLRRATAKAATKESWAVPRAFKGAVAELGGKGGEMVMGIVGAGEKAGIADVETTDIERFVDLVSGERSKWLWYGKPRKAASGDMFSRLPQDRSASPNGEPTHIASLMKRESTLESHGISKQNNADVKRTDTGGTTEGVDKDFSTRAAFKRATEKIETGSGFHRIKDVVGRRNHQTKPSKDEMKASLHLQRTRSDIWPPVSQGTDGSNSAKVTEAKHPRRESLAARRTVSNYGPSIAKVLTETPTASTSTLAEPKISKAQPDGPPESSGSIGRIAITNEPTPRVPTRQPSIACSVYHGIDLNAKLPFEESQEIPPLLRRTQSLDQLEPYHQAHRHNDWYPRHLSFSITEESVLRWRSVVDTKSLQSDEENATSTEERFATAELISGKAKHLYHSLALVSSLDATWSLANLSNITALDHAAESDTMQLESLYYPALESYQSLREDALETLASERTSLQEQMKDLQMLGEKLDYEIGSLRTKVDDVEDGVDELERLVIGVERQVEECEDELGGTKEGWWSWVMRVFTGL